jgi:hypothetical protein
MLMDILSKFGCCFDERFCYEIAVRAPDRQGKRPNSAFARQRGQTRDLLRGEWQGASNQVLSYLETLPSLAVTCKCLNFRRPSSRNEAALGKL